MRPTTKLGVNDMSGPVGKAFQDLQDDNHLAPADENAALANFDRFAATFFSTQEKFIAQAESKFDLPGEPTVR